MILERLIKKDENIEVILKCMVNTNLFKSFIEYDFYAQIKENGKTRNVYPEKLSKKQIKMPVQEYIDHGRCEFFHHVRPNHMFSLIKEVNFYVD